MRSAFRTILRRLLLALLGLFPARQNALSILMYHSVSDSEAFFAVSPSEFEGQVKYMNDTRKSTIFASDISGRMKTGSLSDLVCITFDDGYEDVYLNAYPIIKKYGIKATVFLITSEIGGFYTGSEGKTFRLLNKDQIREMQNSGLFEFMPHGHTHAKLTALSAEEQKREMLISRDAVAALTGKAASIFAYPRGRTNSSIASLARELGFSLALGVRPGLVWGNSDKYDLPRNAVDSMVDTQAFCIKLSDRVQWYAGIARFFKI